MGKKSEEGRNSGRDALPDEKRREFRFARRERAIHPEHGEQFTSADSAD
jgi:hypothetical protein